MKSQKKQLQWPSKPCCCNTRCDRTTASVLARSANAAARVLTRSANDAGNSPRATPHSRRDFVSQAERKALLTSVSQVGERRNGSRTAKLQVSILSPA